MLIYTYKEQVCIKKDHEKFKILDILAVTTQAREGIETFVVPNMHTLASGNNSSPSPKKCLSPAKKYKLYKSPINKSIHFAQRSLSSSTRVQV